MQPSATALRRPRDPRDPRRLRHLPHLAAALLLAAPSALAAVAPAPSTAVAPLVGPPAICHPIDIGDARSLPWDTADAFGVLPDYDLKDAVDDARAVLRGTPDALVHMETVRRAVIYLTGVGRNRHDEVDKGFRRAEIARFVQALKADVTDALMDDGEDAEAARRVALAWFDAGYALAALRQADHGVSAEQAAEGAAMVGRAADLLPDDGGVQLGASIVRFGDGRPDRACYVHLDKALKAADDPQGLLRRNVLHTMGSFLGATNHDELVARVHAALERA